MAGSGSSALTSEYTRALAQGHAYLDIKPSPELLALPDPYDPRFNQGVRLLDAALFKGKYYIYYGLTPFVTVMLPWFWATKSVLPDSQVVAGYGIASLVLIAFLLFDLRRRYFPRARGVWLGLAILAASVCTGMLLLIRNPRIYELVIAAAWFHDCLALVGCYCALRSPRRERVWLAVAGLSAGLAVGARPSHLPMAVAVTALICGRLFFRDKQGKGIRDALTCLGPLAAVALGVAWYNWHRFGNPLNFGYRYLLLDARNFGDTYFSARYVPFNLWHYLFGAPSGSGWFPFFEWSKEGPFRTPVGYYSLDQVYGLLWVAPVCLVAAWLIPLRRSLPAAVRVFATLVAVVGVANLILLCFIDGATYRYETDFLPFGCLGGGIGLLVAADWAKGSRTWRFALVAMGLVFAYSIGASLSAGFALYDIARQNNPADFAWVAHAFNRPRILWENWKDTGLPAIEVKTELPRDKIGQEEPLLVTGRTGLQDFIYLYYVAPGKLQVGFESIGRGGPASAPMDVDYARPVRFEIVQGSEWPPEGAAPYGAMNSAAVETLRRLLMVKVNGNVALEALVDYHPAVGIYHWGASPDDAAFGRSYTGSPLSLSRVSLGRSVAAFPFVRRESYGALLIDMTRDPASAGRRDPLVVIGYRNRWQMVGLVHVDEQSVRFFTASSFDHGEKISEVVRMPVTSRHRLEIRAAGLMPAVGSPSWQTRDLEMQRAYRGKLSVRIDGKEVLQSMQDGPEVGPSAVVVGRNPLGVDNTEIQFAGKVSLLPARGEVP